jgi:hypothetical protein
MNYLLLLCSTSLHTPSMGALAAPHIEVPTAELTGTTSTSRNQTTLTAYVRLTAACTHSFQPLFSNHQPALLCIKTLLPMCLTIRGEPPHRVSPAPCP